MYAPNPCYSFIHKYSAVILITDSDSDTLLTPRLLMLEQGTASA